MAIPGEIGWVGKTCPDCGCVLEATVLQSAAGFYVGTHCACGPFSRESGYYRTRDEAQLDLDAELYWR